MDFERSEKERNEPWMMQQYFFSKSWREFERKKCLLLKMKRFWRKKSIFRVNDSRLGKFVCFYFYLFNICLFFCLSVLKFVYFNICLFFLFVCFSVCRFYCLCSFDICTFWVKRTVAGKHSGWRSRTDWLFISRKFNWF